MRDRLKRAAYAVYKVLLEGPADAISPRQLAGCLYREHRIMAKDTSLAIEYLITRGYLKAIGDKPGAYQLVPTSVEAWEAIEHSRGRAQDLWWLELVS